MRFFKMLYNLPPSKKAGNAASYLIATMAIMSMSVSMLSFIGPGKINQGNEQNTIKLMMNEVAENHLNDLESYIQGNTELFFQTRRDGSWPGWNPQVYIDTQQRLKTFITPLPNDNEVSVINRMDQTFRQRAETLDYNGQSIAVNSVVDTDVTNNLYGLKRFVTRTQDKAMLITVTTTLASNGQSIRKSRLITLSDDNDCLDDAGAGTIETFPMPKNRYNNYTPARQASSYFQIGAQQVCDSLVRADSTVLSCIEPTLEGPGLALNTRNNHSYVLGSYRNVIPQLNDTQWVINSLEIDPSPTNPSQAKGYVVTRVLYTNHQSMSKIFFQQIYGPPVTPAPAGTDLDRLTPVPAELMTANVAPGVVGKYVKNIYIPAKTRLGSHYNIILFAQSNTIASIHIDWRINAPSTSDLTQADNLIRTSNGAAVAQYSRFKPLLATQTWLGGPFWNAKFVFNPVTDAWDYNSSSGLLTVASTSPQYQPTTLASVGPQTSANNIFTWIVDLNRAQFTEDTAPTPFSLSNNALLIPTDIAMSGGSALLPKANISAFRQVLAPDATNGPLLFTANYTDGGADRAGVFAYSLANRMMSGRNTALIMAFSETSASPTAVFRGKTLANRANDIFLFRFNGTPHWVVRDASLTPGLKSSQFIYAWNPNRWGHSDNAQFENNTGLGTSNQSQMAGEFRQVRVISRKQATPVNLYPSANTPEIKAIDSSHFALRNNGGSQNSLVVVSPDGYELVSAAPPPSQIGNYGNSMQYLKPFLYFTADVGSIQLFRHNLKTRQTDAIQTLPNSSIGGHGGLALSENIKRLFLVDTSFATSGPSADFDAAVRVFSPGCRKRESIAGEFEGFTKIGIGNNSIQWSDSNPQITVIPARGDTL
jgi:hypothetical protein